MSNNLVSHQLSIPSNQMSQLEPIPNKLDSSIQMGLIGAGTNDPSLQQISVSNMQMGLMGPGSSGPVSQQISVSDMQAGLLDHVSNSFRSQVLASNQQTGQMEHQFLVPNKQTGEMEPMQINVESILSKRKAPGEPSSNIYGAHKLLMPNKRVAQMEHRPWLQQVSAPNKRSVQNLQMQSISNSPRSQNLPAPNKKTIQMESIPSKSGPPQLLIPKNQNAMQPSPKNQSNSFESVRSKMRESLAVALALVSPQQEEPLNAVKNSQSDVANTAGETQENSQQAGLASAAADAVDHAEELKETLRSKEDCSGQKCSNSQGASQETFDNGNTCDTTQTPKSDGRELQLSNVLPDEDVSFSENIFAKDELLQGNGLSWVLDPEIEVAAKKEIQTAKNQNLDHGKVGGDGGGQSDHSPQILALKIEVELFKFFGGVNKKYKEKGRSLLFNLKDRSNPELRERVMAGEISPERLCSMTAEELASKELSQWRIAKAEELAQMVVLPDTEVDMRRLVKKTHKGEFQVELEQNENASVEVSGGAGSLPQTQSKINEKEASPLSKASGIKDKGNGTGEKSDIEDKDIPCTITIPSPSNDGTDLMQGLMVDDELKDAEFLPPIVSLDEFMESLDSEPPFENLPVEAGRETPMVDKDDSEVGSETKSSDRTPQDPVDSVPDEPNNIRRPKSDPDMKVSDKHVNSEAMPPDNHIKSETTSPVAASKGEHVWEGLLQLNISATASVIGLFKSGEKTSAKEWPGFLEIKGRVRLDAFEKFLQELPMSRSRAVMVLHFVCKEGSPKTERGSLCEVADSYVLDGRVGFAEPASGVELYFCPPHAKTLEMLSKILPKDLIESLNAVDNGLIGVVVWRKPHLTSTISPNSAAHHKHSSKKQHFTSRRHQDKDTNTNVNLTSKSPLPHSGPPIYAKPPPDNDDDDDDVPPGFGPAAARDEDDLPEFNFSVGSNPPGPQFASQTPSRGPRMASFHPHSQTTARPVEQMRELIHKYGQTETNAPYKGGMGIAIQPWNDDDDDIPEWQPHAPQHPISQPARMVNNFQQPTLQPYMVNQLHAGPAQPHQPTALPPMPLQQPPLNVMQGQPYAGLSRQQGQGPWWGPPSGGQSYGAPAPGLGVGQPSMGWRQDAPKSRGF